MLLSSFTHSISSGSLLHRGGNRSLPLGRGVASPLPPTSVLLLPMQAGVENGLVCLVTSVPLVTNAGSAPHPLEIG